MKKMILLPCLFLMAALSFAQPAGDYKDTPALPKGLPGERIQALIAAFNANDPEVLKAFLDKHCTEGFRNFAPLEMHWEAFSQTYRLTGGLDFYGIRSYDQPRDETVVVLKDHLFGDWQAFVLNFDVQDGYRVSGINFNPARPPKDQPVVKLDEEEMIAYTSGLIDCLCKQDVFSGTLLIAKGDQVLLEKACGEATKSWHVANNIDTKFNLGSMNKMFTATAIAQLVEKGLLSYDTPISQYVDETWLPKSITDKVTVHHLLTHTSGLGSYFNDTYMKGSRELYRNVEDFKPLVVGDTLSFEPGARFQYSNTGMLLLGVVIEKATGMSYFDYIRKNIYKPAGMTNTDCYELDHPTENLAEGYIPDPGHPSGWKNNLFMHVIKGGPAGGGYSTVRDLHRFARALQSGKLLSQASLDKMWTPHSEAGYGYGFQIDQGPGGRSVGHGGGFPGLNSNLQIFLDSGYIIVVMSNYDMGASPVARHLESKL